jgi:RHS repeat-associated protein
MPSLHKTLKLLMRVSLAVGLSLAFSHPMHAQWCAGPFNPPKPPLPEQPAAKCQPKDPCLTCSGSPCYVASGAYVADAQDLQIRTAGFPLTASRTYRSTQAIDGPLGSGWSSTLASRVYYSVYLFAAPSTYQKIAYVIMPDTGRLRFTDNGNGAFAPPSGSRDTLVQNADGTFDLTPQRTRSRFHFAVDGSLQTMTDDYGNALAFTYDGSGKLQRIADVASSGRYLNVFWGADGRISGVQDSSGRQVQYAYTLGALTAVTDAGNRVTTYSYSQGRFAPHLSRITDNWSRVITDVTYDTSDRVRTYTENGDTYTYTYAYQGNTSLTAKTDSSGHTYVYQFAAAGYVTDRTPPAGGGGATHMAYYPDGSIQQFTDAVGVKTFYTYTADGGPLTVTRDYQGPTAIRFDYAYDPTFPWKVASILPSDPKWQGWKYDYWQSGDPVPGALHHVYAVKSDGLTLDTLATYEYDSLGRMTGLTSSTGGVTEYGYDASGNLTTVTAPANNDAGIRPVTTYAYDSLGRVTSVTDPLSHVTTCSYDTLDRVTALTLPKPSPSSTLNFISTYSFDNFDGVSGLVFVNVTDPNSRTTRQGYDQYGQLGRSSDALGNVTLYGYTRGLLTSVTDANGNVMTYGYDSGRRLISTALADSAVERYAYTADNLLYQMTDRKNQTVTYAYDHLKRLALKTYPDSTSVAFTYQGEKASQVVDTSVSPAETHIFAYDSSYRLRTETEATRGTVTRVYTAEEPPGLVKATYSYYPDGSVDTITWTPVSGNFKYTYTLAGQYQTVTFPNGQTRNFSYDDQGRIAQVANLTSGGANLATFAYGYDLNYTTGSWTMLGQRVSMTATVPSQGFAGHQTTYEYDPLYRLVKTTYPNVSPLNSEIDSWTYDAIGNRLTATVNGSTQNYTYQKIGTNPNNWQRLLSDGSNTYSYDANGSTVGRSGPGGNFAFGWNQDNRLLSITGSASAAYVYDYQGRRSRKAVAGSTDYLYDGLNLLRETGASASDYLGGPGLDEPLAIARGGQAFYYATDALGSVAVVTDSSGTVQKGYLYDAWGQIRSQTGNLINPFTYTAREADEAGLDFYRARYYSPAIGRFLSEDPIKVDGLLEGKPTAAAVIDSMAVPVVVPPYGYASGNPAAESDPSGHGVFDCAWYGYRCNKVYWDCKDKWCEWLNENEYENRDRAFRAAHVASDSDFFLKMCFWEQPICKKAFDACGKNPLRPRGGSWRPYGGWKQALAD